MPDGKALRIASLLGLTEAHVTTLARVFGRMDYLKEKHVSSETVVRELRLEQGAELAKVVLRMGDHSGYDYMTFTEFIISCWTLCTHNSKMLPRFAMSLFDLDGSGDLSAAEIAFVGYLLWNFNPSPGVTQAMHDLEKTDDLLVNLDEYCDPLSPHSSESLALHAVEMQLALMTGTLGMRDWTELARLRRQTHGAKSVFQALKLSRGERRVLRRAHLWTRLGLGWCRASSSVVVRRRRRRARRWRTSTTCTRRRKRRCASVCVWLSAPLLCCTLLSYFGYPFLPPSLHPYTMPHPPS